MRFYPISKKKDFNRAKRFKFYKENCKICEYPAIFKIRMGSPGGVSFVGAAEIIQQLREFIKDLCYRNKHEKRLAELEEERKQIENAQLLLSFFNRAFPNFSYSKKTDKELNEVISLLICQKIYNLNNLQKKGKIIDLAENLDYLPTDE